MFIVKYYATGALLALVVAVISPFWWLSAALLWVALSLSLVSTAYLFKKPHIFRKKQNGEIPWYIRWLFIPFLSGVHVYNLWARKHDQVPAIQKIDDKLYLACRLVPADLEHLTSEGVKAIVDVTAEFDGLDWSANAQEFAYLNVPVLDHQSPEEQDLLHAVNWIDNHIRAGRAVTVHCALGRGRSVLVVAAYLLSKNRQLSVDAALSKIRDIRQTASLNHFQLKSLSQIHRKGILDLRQDLWIIANPVSGGGKWQEYKSEIEQHLSPYFRLHINETTKELSAKQLAQQAIRDGAETLIACGGDGTLSEVAGEVIKYNLILGIIPMGTANALAHVLYGNRSKLQPVSAACEHIIEYQVQTIDTARCNGHLVLLAAGIGFEQQMIASADREKKDQGGQLAYVKALWDAILRNEAQTLHIEVDNQPQQTIQVSSLIIANAAPFLTVLAQGGGEPDFQDGLLDITWLPARENAGEHVLSMTELAMSGLFEGFQADSVEYTQASRIKITAQHPIDYVVDGENYRDNSLDIRVQPGSLKILANGMAQ